MTEEAMLFRRVQEGCWEAFDVLFHTYAEQLFFYAMGFVNNREEARDIVQGTFITLWEQRGKIQCTGAIYPYLLRLVKNACLNYQVHEKVKDAFEKIEAAGKYLQQLADDVLDLTQIENGQMKFLFQKKQRLKKFESFPVHCRNSR